MHIHDRVARSIDSSIYTSREDPLSFYSAIVYFTSGSSTIHVPRTRAPFRAVHKMGTAAQPAWKEKLFS